MDGGSGGDKAAAVGEGPVKEKKLRSVKAAAEALTAEPADKVLPCAACCNLLTHRGTLAASLACSSAFKLCKSAVWTWGCE